MTKPMEKKEKTKFTRCTTAANLHVRETGDGETPSRVITGYAILFGVESVPLWSDNDSEAREIIAPEAITKELLDGCDIKFTMFHDHQLILARSREGKGTLKYDVDDKGVSFEFEAPATIDGDKALELVRRGDLSGCSFAFTTDYWDARCVERTVKRVGNRSHITYTVRVIDAVHDFTLAADPAYPETSVESRELENLRKDALGGGGKTGKSESETVKAQIREMRALAGKRIV